MNVFGKFAFVCLLLFAVPLSAQEYQVGDRVRIDFMNEQIEAEVVGVNRSGWPKLSFEWKFGPMTQTLPPAVVLGKIEGANASSDGDAKDANANSGEVREWTDVSGKHSIKGKFVKIEGDTVHLAGEKGNSIEIAISKLNPVDAELARSLANPTTSNRSMRGGSVDDAVRSARERMNSKKRSGRGSKREADYSAFPLTKFDTASAKSYSTDPTKSARVKFFEDTSKTKIPEAVTRWFSWGKEAKLDGITTDPNNWTRVCASDYNLRSKQTTFYLIDIESGHKSDWYTIPMEEARIKAFDATNNRLLTSNRGFSGRKSVDVWQIGGKGEVKHLIGFFAGEGRFSKKPIAVEQAVFLNPRQVMVTAGSTAGVFDLGSKKAVWKIDFDHATKISISVDGRYVYGKRGNRLSIFDSQSKEVVCSPSFDFGPFQVFDILRDGTQAVFFHDNELIIWDLVNDKRIDHMVYPMNALSVVFVDKENVILNHVGASYLVNLPLKSIIWKYSGTQFESFPGSSELWATQSNYAGVKLGFQALPHWEAQQIIDGMKFDDLVEAKPGSDISVSFGNIGHESKAFLKNQLKTLGYQLVPNSDLVLKATITTGKTGSQRYKGLGGAADETVFTRSDKYEISLEKRGRKVWFIESGSGGGSAPGGIVMLDPGEKVQDIVNKRRTGPGGFFGSVELPGVFSHVPRSRFYNGSITITEDGFPENPQIRDWVERENAKQ